VNPNKALWEKGDFTRLAQSIRESGESLVKGLGITKGLKVLDLGCGRWLTLDADSAVLKIRVSIESAVLYKADYVLSASA